MQKISKILFLVFFVTVATSFSLCAQNLTGPKKTVAVIDFENTSGLRSYVNLGGDFAAQLTDSLIQSGQFTVLSRRELIDVFGEQDLAASGRMAESLTAQKGRAIPAQILITGKVTEFEQGTKGGSQGLSIRGIRLGGSRSIAHIGVITQIIDSTTGQVLDSKRIEGKAESGGFNIGYSGSFDIGTSSFQKTPLGKATQIAIDRSVEYIAGKLSEIPWKGRVVTVQNELVYLNSGSDNGIGPDMTFSVWRQGESLTDPETGIKLGSQKEKIGDIKITEVYPKYSKAKVIFGDAALIKRADLVLK